MPRFSSGDRVQRIGPFAPEYMKNGIVITVTYRPENPEFTQYEVSFEGLLLTLYEKELVPIASPSEVR